jgi:DNA-binding response OmpR family regulator
MIETISGHQIQCNDARHLVILDGVALACSPREYRILLPLLRHANHALPFAQLLDEADDPNDWRTRRNLGRVVSRLRAKLWPFGFDIFCLFHYGYQLVTPGAVPGSETEAR